MTITNTKTGETFTDDADILMTARGQLNQVSWPNIPGLDKFGGKLMHSAEWDDQCAPCDSRLPLGVDGPC